MNCFPDGIEAFEDRERRCESGSRFLEGYFLPARGLGDMRASIRNIYLIRFLRCIGTVVELESSIVGCKEYFIYLGGWSLMFEAMKVMS